jgi:endonuclease G
MKTMIKVIRSASIFILATVLLAGCTTPVMVSRPVLYSVALQQRQAGLSPADQKRVDTHCPFGMPKLDARWNFGPTDLVPRDGYVLQHSASDKIPLWVCEYVERQQLTGKADRDDKFQADPILKPGRRAELSDYLRSGFDRGHQAPAGNQTRDKRLKAETFFLSNMAPQSGPMNQQIWRELEAEVRDWMIKLGSGYIITGGMFYDPREEDAGTAHGLVQHMVIGTNGVAVPTHFYKIAIATNASGKLDAVGFVMENKPYKRPFRIEKRTGLDFMPELDPVEQRRLESGPGRMWN